MPRRPIPSLGCAVALWLAAPMATAQEESGLAGAYLAAEQARAAGDFDAAADFYMRALEFDADNAALMREALVALGAMGRWDAAAPLAGRLEDAGRAGEVANTILLVDMIRNGAYQGALDRIEADRGTGPLADGLVAGWVALGTGDLDAARRRFEADATGGVLTQLAWYQTALALAVSGEYAAADAILSGEAHGALQVSTRGIRAHAQILVQLDRPEDAIALLDAAAAQDTDPALPALRDAIAADPDLPFTLIETPAEGAAEVFQTLAAALPDEAGLVLPLLYARAASVLAPDNVDARLLTGQLLAGEGRAALAIEAYASVPTDHPAAPVADVGRANALIEIDRVTDAIEVMQAAAERHPDNPTVQATLGDTLRRAERYAEASAAYDRAVALIDRDDPRYWFLFFARGVTYDNTDRWEAAEADFRHALDLNPGQPTVLNYLGYALVEQQRNLDEALSMIERAVEARPRSGYIVDSLGWVLYRLGRYDEAVAPMERAVELMPEDPILNDHLGDVYWMVDRSREARFQWERALNFGPEPDAATRIRRKLDVGLDSVLEQEEAAQSPTQ